MVCPSIDLIVMVAQTNTNYTIDSFLAIVLKTFDEITYPTGSSGFFNKNSFVPFVGQLLLESYFNNDKLITNSNEVQADGGANNIPNINFN